MSSPGRTAVVLFTRDLRVHDQPALGEAARTATQVVPLFVLDPALERPGKAPNRGAFLLAALADLRRSLRGLGADLVVRRGDPVEQTLRVAHAVGASHVFVGSDASAYAKRREERLARECRRARIELRVENTTAAVPPGELAPADRDYYSVFTPYWERWRAEPLAAVGRPGGSCFPPASSPAASRAHRSRQREAASAKAGDGSTGGLRMGCTSTSAGAPTWREKARRG